MEGALLLVVQEQEPPRPVVDEDQEQADPEGEREFINNIMEDNMLDLDVDYEDYRILYESEWAHELPQYRGERRASDV